MFFVLASKLPLVDVKNGHDLVYKNQTTLGIAVVFYGIMAYLIYSQKIESWLSFIPDKKYLIGIVVLDFLLYVALHWLEFGQVPNFIASDEIVSKKRITNQVKESKQIMNSDQQNSLPSKPNTNNKRKSKPSQLRIREDLPDDIDSALKESVTEFYENDDENMAGDGDNMVGDGENMVGNGDDDDSPQEASTKGKNFFPKDDKTMVENWDLDDYTHEDCVSDDDNDEHHTDEILLEK